MLNSWDGSLTIDEKNGTILSTMIGAGKKDNLNRFNGVLMGDISTAENTKNTGIYGIYIDDKLVYIGKTTTSFEQRFKEHNKNINDTMYIHKLMREAKKDGLSVYMKPIITLEDLKMEGKKVINNKELECMELALITAYKPIGNIEGRIKPYVFRK